MGGVFIMNRTKKLVFVALYVALAIVLDYVKEMLPFLNMPQGGSINIALIPVMVASFHLGAGYGFVTGLLWWAVTSLMGLNNWILSLPQYLCDYVVPSILPGLAAIFCLKKRNIFKEELGIFTVMALRTLMVVLSGAYFWPGDAAAGSAAAWAGSLAYNLPYSIATAVMLMLVCPLIINRLNVIK